MSEFVNVNLDVWTWQWLQISIWVVIGLVMAVICVAGAWGIYQWLTPLESKTIRKASRRKKPLIILERDDGVLEFKIGHKVGPEGILETEPSKKDKRNFTGFVARSTEQTQHNPNNLGLSEKEKKEAETTMKLAEALAGLATRKSFLAGAKIPALVGYAGKVILTRIGHLVGLQILEKLDELEILPADLTMIKTLFPMPWDQTQLAAQGQQKYQEGYWKAKKDSGGYESLKPIILMLIVMFGLIAAIVVIWKML